MEQNTDGQATGRGPGLERRPGIDVMLLTSGAFTLLGFTPDAAFDATVGYSHFGPLAWSAILAMVGVLFAVIAGLRGYDSQDKPLLRGAGGLFVVGMLRLFLAPLF